MEKNLLKAILNVKTSSIEHTIFCIGHTAKAFSDCLDVDSDIALNLIVVSALNLGMAGGYHNRFLMVFLLYF